MLAELLAEPLFWKIALTLLAPVCFVFGFRWWRRARLIDDTPTSRIRSAAQGYVELSGRAGLAGGVQQVAPLSGRPCVWWLFRVERKRRSGKNTHWDTVNRGLSDRPFLLTDETGSCLVNPQGAEVHPSDKTVWYGSTPWPVPMTAGATGFARLGADYRYTEHRIYEHERVDVIGEFRTLGGVTAVDSENVAAELLREWKSDQKSLLAKFDTNGDGILSQAEWEHARQAARREVQTRQLQQEVASQHLMSRPADDRPFLLAACDLGKLAQRYRAKAMACLLGFVVLAGVDTFLWLG